MLWWNWWISDWFSHPPIQFPPPLAFVCWSKVGISTRLLLSFQIGEFMFSMIAAMPATWSDLKICNVITTIIIIREKTHVNHHLIHKCQIPHWDKPFHESIEQQRTKELDQRKKVVMAAVVSQKAYLRKQCFSWAEQDDVSIMNIWFVIRFPAKSLQ